jgi:hypothetical protein
LRQAELKQVEPVLVGELRPALDAIGVSASDSAAQAEMPPAKDTTTLPVSDAAPAAPGVSEPPIPDLPKPEIAKPPEPRRTGPVAVFVSRKERKVFVRQGFEPLFDAPVTIVNPDQPLGTHVFTAMEFKEDGATLRWTAVSMPGEPDVLRHHPPKGRRIADVLHERTPTRAKPAAPLPAPQSASSVLDRIELPPEAVERISELMSPGSSLVVSDYGLGYETGRGTDFIVVTR